MAEDKAMSRTWSIFTKPWRTLTPDALGEMVASWGFNAVEFPLRPGYQVEPDNAERDMPRLLAALKAHGVHISSVASGTDEGIFAACQAAQVSILRIMVSANRELGYLQSIDNTRAMLDGLIPLCEKYGVTVGIQHHYGFGVFNTMEMRHLLEGYDPRYVAAIWDAAHSALSGEIPAQAIDIIHDRLCLVNLKMAYYHRVNGPEAAQASFAPYFTTATNGPASWADAAQALAKYGYDGDICMPAEYTDEANVEKYIVQDVAYAKSLFEG